MDVGVPQKKGVGKDLGIQKNTRMCVVFDQERVSFCWTKNKGWKVFEIHSRPESRRKDFHGFLRPLAKDSWLCVSGIAKNSILRPTGILPFINHQPNKNNKTQKPSRIHHLEPSTPQKAQFLNPNPTVDFQEDRRKTEIPEAEMGVYISPGTLQNWKLRDGDVVKALICRDTSGKSMCLGDFMCFVFCLFWKFLRRKKFSFTCCYTQIGVGGLP